MKRSVLISVISFAVGVGTYAFVQRYTDNHPAKDDSGLSKSVAYAWTKDAEGISEITLEREPCYGGCPVYKVILRRDGPATYIGRENVPRIGKYQSQIHPYQPLGAEFIRLAKLIASQGYLKMNDRYTVSVTDAETVITSIVHNGERKTIVNYGNQAPVELYGIEMAIDGVAAPIKWEEDERSELILSLVLDTVLKKQPA
ncbi:MAG: DUF6438 domain-containing protein [Acidobacteriota bacterium]|nr:DUF6438 domain-containing protein [Acidobacteriota bacterium]